MVKLIDKITKRFKRYMLFYAIQKNFNHIAKKITELDQRLINLESKKLKNN
ncbi:unnamed protein product [marine sediment metagenome]|uniref:Uncharacterized protein n=1 Tax=marine sediment metagenome TaxID=412755 RepID=X0ZM57_9ZZZZ